MSTTLVDMVRADCQPCMIRERECSALPRVAFAPSIGTPDFRSAVVG